MLHEADVDRSVDEHIRQSLHDVVTVYRQGEGFAAKPGEWAEVRVKRFKRSGSGPGNKGGRVHRITLVVRCIRQNAQKGITGALAELVDKVRPVVDFTAGAPGLHVLNKAGERVGFLQFVEADTDRDYDVTVVTDGVSTPSCDLATLTVECVVTALCG